MITNKMKRRLKPKRLGMILRLLTKVLCLLHLLKIPFNICLQRVLVSLSRSLIVGLKMSRLLKAY